MGVPVLVIGQSGSGKSTSLRNFEKDDVGIFNVACKPLPFRKKLINVNVPNGTDRFDFIKKYMKSAKCKSLVIDDAQYLMAFYLFDKAKDIGYTKYTECALKFRGLIDFVVHDLPDDVIVYFLQHTEETDKGVIKAKTSGKMLDNQLTLEGLFSIVLLCETDGKEHWFTTQSDGFTTAKSPMDMFNIKIDNDLKFVDNAIREYYEMNKKEK